MAIYGTLGDIDVTSTDYPSTQPTLDLNFAKSKVLDQRITFYRNSLGTYTDDRGIIRTVPENVPRFDHNPATGESLGLLLEESRTNYVRYSTNFTLAEWASSMSSTVADQITAPDGTSTADLISGTGFLRYFTSTVSYNSTGVHTISLYVKAGTSTTVRLNRYDGTNDEGATFNLTGSGSVSNAYGPPDRTYIQQLANGWYRCELTCTNLASADFQIHLDNAGTLYIWGAQFEAGSFATSYIPTSGSTIARAVDNVSIANPTFSFPCTIYGEYDTQVLQYARRLYEIIPTGATGTQSIRPLIQNSGDFDFFTSYTSSHSVTGPAVVNTGFKFCQVIRTSGYNTVSLNGGAVTNSSATTTLTSTSTSSLVLGNSSFGDSPRNWCGHIRRFMVYNSALTNTQIQNLTL
jgi:hypothetical protein